MTNVENMLKQFASIRKAYGKYLYATMKNHNFSPSEIDVLIFLSNNPSINTSKELVVCLAVSKSLIARSVDALMQKGMIEMQGDEDDHRIQHLKITKTAIPYIEEIKKYRESFTKEALVGIDEQELQGIETTIRKIESNLQRIIRGEQKL